MLETGGNATFAEPVRALARGGTMAMIGYVSGSRLEMDMRQVFIAKRARLHGHTVGNARQFDAMNRTMEAHGIVPLVASVHPFGHRCSLPPACVRRQRRQGPSQARLSRALTGRRG